MGSGYPTVYSIERSLFKMLTVNDFIQERRAMRSGWKSFSATDLLAAGLSSQSKKTVVEDTVKEVKTTSKKSSRVKEMSYR